MTSVFFQFQVCTVVPAAKQPTFFLRRLRSESGSHVGQATVNRVAQSIFHLLEAAPGPPVN